MQNGYLAYVPPEIPAERRRVQLNNLLRTVEPDPSKFVFGGVVDEDWHALVRSETASGERLLYVENDAVAVYANNISVRLKSLHKLGLAAYRR